MNDEYAQRRDESLDCYQARMVTRSQHWNPFVRRRARNALQDIARALVRAAQLRAAVDIVNARPAVRPPYPSRSTIHTPPARPPYPSRSTDSDDSGFSLPLSFDTTPSFDAPSFDSSPSTDSFSGGGGDFGGGGSDSSW